MYNTIEYQSTETIAYITFNRPKVHNAFNEEMIDELIDCFDKLSKDEDIQTLVLKSSIKSFCSGADVNWMKKMVNYSEEENLKDSYRLSEMLDKLFNLPQYTIALVDGSTLGGGVGVISCVDQVIASYEAVFGLTEVRLGLVPAVISPYVINKIGAANARRYFVTGERIDIIEAYRIGLVNIAVESLDLVETLSTTLRELALGGAKAKRLAKELCLKHSRKSIEENKEYTCKLIAQTRVSAEAQEGMNALLSKKKPSWATD